MDFVLFLPTIQQEFLRPLCYDRNRNHKQGENLQLRSRDFAEKAKEFVDSLSKIM
jgi:hypothetical protein